MERKKNEKDFSTQQSPSAQGTRLQEKNELPRRQEGFAEKKVKGEKGNSRLISPALRNTDKRFGKEERLLKSGDFRKAYDKGSRYSNENFVLYVHADGSGTPRNGEGGRLGISVGRRLGKAVIRNRIKRLVREVYRGNKDHLHLDDKVDLVVVPRKTDIILNYHRVKRSLEDLFRKAGLYRS